MQIKFILPLIVIACVSCGKEASPKIPTPPQTQIAPPTTYDVDPQASAYNTNQDPGVFGGNSAPAKSGSVLDVLPSLLQNNSSTGQSSIFSGTLLQQLKEKREQNGGLLGLGILGQK